MPLRLSLKAGERLIVGGAVVRNAGHRTALLIENDVPILRGREVMALDDADSPCRRIYFTIQLMYVDTANLADHRQLYLQLLRDVLEASPSMAPRLKEINELVANGQYYQALKRARKLIAYEQELISHVPHRG
ncbi:MAG: flagellar biosynthesis repressor FlbT [Gemmatimonadales bacterium]